MSAKKSKIRKPRPAVYVFVYGSLKKGHRLSGWMATSDLLGTGTLWDHALISLGAYPALVKLNGIAGGFGVEGEVYLMPADDFDHLRAMEERVGYSTQDVVVQDSEGVSFPVCKAFVFAELDKPGIHTWKLNRNGNGSLSTL